MPAQVSLSLTSLKLATSLEYTIPFESHVTWIKIESYLKHANQTLITIDPNLIT